MRSQPANRDTLAKTALNRSNRALEEFASITSHDLKEPLRKIRAFGERLELRAGAAMGDTSRDFLSRMLNAAARMSALIDDVLRYSRIGQDQLTLPPVPLGPLLHEITGDDPSITVGVMPTIEGDAIQLHQLFANLIGNARKFIRPDVPPSIIVSATADAHDATIVVEDNGLGIAPEHRDRVFGMFRRLHGASAYAGSGIGLALCRLQIVELPRG